MYASNEDEDWIYLHETPPTNTVLENAVNLVDDESDSSSSYSSSSSSSSSISTISDRSASLSSISSNELEHALNDDSTNHQTATSEDPVLLPQDNNQQVTLTSTAKDIDANISTVAEENDVLNTGFELSKTPSLTNSSESLSLPNTLRCRTGVNTQEKDLYKSEIIQSTPIYQDFKPRKRIGLHHTKADSLISCTCMIVLLTLPFILGSIVTRWDQSMIYKITKELDTTNQRLNDLKDIPTGNIEEKLTKRLEEKFQTMIHQQLAWQEHEKYAFISQILELRNTLNITEQNLTNTIHQLTNENEELKEQIKLLENRLETTEERYPKDKNTCTEGVNCSKSTFDKLVTNIFKQTASIAADTSFNLSGLFEHLSASVRRKKLSTSEKIQTSFRRGVENISSSFRKAKLTYATWFKSRVQKTLMEKPIPKKFPWRWTFQRHHQTSNKNNVCQSKFYFPINKICSMKNWMVKFFRP